MSEEFEMHKLQAVVNESVKTVLRNHQERFDLVSKRIDALTRQVEILERLLEIQSEIK